MAKRLQHRGGTTSQHSTFTGAVREVTVDTDKNTLVVHDGATAGGHPLATATNFTSTGIDDNATSTAITIDSGGNVGIGTTNIDNLSGYASLRIGTAGSIWCYNLSNNSSTFISDNISKQGGTYIRTDFATSYRQGDGDHRWYNAPSGSAGSAVTLSERMRIDSSGRLLVGKTSDNNNSTGCQVEGDGTLSASRNGFAPLILNRQTSDGKIAEFRNDGTEFGNIGSHNGLLIIGGGDTGIKFSSGVDSIFPFDVNTNANRDNAVDFGYSTVRWKDLYVGGGLYVGGTGTANKLDDYEEGTWTPSLIDYAGTPTVQEATYTKIGRLVTVATHISLDGTSDGSQYIISGLPFTSGTVASYYGGFVTYTSSAVTHNIYPFLNTSNTRIYLYKTSGNGMSYNDLGTGANLRLVATYIT